MGAPCSEDGVTRFGYCDFHASAAGILVHRCRESECPFVSIDIDKWRAGMTLADYDRERIRANRSVQ